MNRHYHHASQHLKTFNSRIEFLVLGLLNYRYSKRIFDFFEQPVFSDIALAHPMLKRKILHRYLYCGMNVEKKAVAIMEHYAFICEMFTPEAIRLMCCGSSLCLIEFKIGFETYTVEFGYSDSFFREGELAIILMDSQKRRVYSIAFTFLRNKQHTPSLYIGGIQGPEQTDSSAQETIRTITKEMYGLRPRTFMISIIKQLASLLDISTIVCVASDMHVSQCHHLPFKRSKRFQADYDLYWEEEGGVRRGDFYLLAIHHKRKNIDEIESRKRSLYKKRYHMMDEISNAISVKVESLKHPYCTSAD